jgi:diaminopimelate epimerase
MCGNAARCAVRYYYWQSRSNQQTMSFETLAGVICGQILPSGMIEVVMPQAKYFQWNLNETIAGDSLLFDWINSGVPHAVVQIHENSRFQSLKPMAKALREHHRFAPGGTNVTLFRWLNTERIAAQTYERGVEDFTLACGTGAVAVGLVAFQKRPELRTVEIQMPGGVLSVSNEAHPRLTGPAELIAKIEWLG